MGKRAKKGAPCPEGCRGLCCRYISTKIDAPRTKMDFDELYWFLSHERVEVFIESRKWYLLFETPCRNLDEKSRCRIYPRRPHVCRQHSEAECEYWGKQDGKARMHSTEDLKKYLERRRVRVRMAWDEPEEGPGRTNSSRSRPRSTQRS